MKNIFYILLVIVGVGAFFIYANNESDVEKTKKAQELFRKYKTKQKEISKVLSKDKSIETKTMINKGVVDLEKKGAIA